MGRGSILLKSSRAASDCSCGWLPHPFLMQLRACSGGFARRPEGFPGVGRGGGLDGRSCALSHSTSSGLSARASLARGQDHGQRLPGPPRRISAPYLPFAEREEGGGGVTEETETLNTSCGEQSSAKYLSKGFPERFPRHLGDALVMETKWTIFKG